MNSKCLILLLLTVLLFSGCGVMDDIVQVPVNTATPEATTNQPVNTMGVTPNVTATDSATSTTTPDVTLAVTPSPTAIITAETTTAKPTENPNKAKNAQDMKSFLPPLDTELRFFGIAETGHYGTLTEKYSDSDEAMYEFKGTYDDGMGVPDKFKIQYFFNYSRGTITEKALYNERLDKNEFHSKLHNIVVLKFPLSLGSTWSHETTINGSKYWVYAEVIEYDGNVVKILYSASGVDDYYDETYFEMRTYEVDYGMTSFGNIMPGDLDMTGVDTTDEDAVKEHIMNMHMFGYSLYK